MTKIYHAPAETANAAMNIVIFSKNRACQLDSLLRSLKKHFKAPVNQTHILYHHSNEPFAAAYELLQMRNRWPAYWRRESDFFSDIRTLIASLPPEELLMFLVDDDIFFRPFNDLPLLKSLSRKHLFISLRYDRHYPTLKAPAFIRVDPFLEYRWHYAGKKRVVWNYPFSLDGHIYRTSVIQKIIKRIDCAAPNSMEGRMHRYRHAWWIKRTALALAPQNAVLYNNPLNKVQTEGETWHRNITPQWLNEQYLDGKIINNDRLYAATPDATHFAVEPVLHKEAKATTQR